MGLALDSFMVQSLSNTKIRAIPVMKASGKRPESDPRVNDLGPRP